MRNFIFGFASCFVLVCLALYLIDVPEYIVTYQVECRRVTAI